MDYPIFRILAFIALTGMFFYRDWPGAKWRWYVPFYWLGILFIGYYGLSAMVSAGVSELFIKYTDSGNMNRALEDQLTFTSLGLLFLYRLFSRYEVASEKTKWATNSIKGIITAYLAVGALFFGFADYLVVSPKLEVFSRTPLAYSMCGILCIADFGFWFWTRKTKKS